MQMVRKGSEVEMTAREDTIERIERVLKLTHKNSITVTIPKLTAERAVSMLKEQEWISVEERLPKSMANKVLVYLQHDELVSYIGYGHYEKFKGEEMWYDLENNEQFSERGYTVTHWMPLPESPNGERLTLS